MVSLLNRKKSVSPSNNQPDSNKPNTNKDDSGPIITLWGMLIITTISLIFIPALFIGIDPTFSMVLLVIFGIVDFVVVLTIAGSVYIKTDLACKEEALGLPSGSIRALIALGLIIIFAIMTIYMYNQLTPNTLIIDVPGNTTYVFSNGTAIMNPNGMKIATEASQAQRDFSTQTLSTVSTLVVALAGFYFGSKASVLGKKKEVAEPEYDVAIKQKSELEKGKPIVFSVDTNPKNATLKLLAVDGDNPVSFDLKNVKTKNEILYVPSSEHKNVVKAVFALMVDGKIKATEDVSVDLEKMVATTKPSSKLSPNKPFTFEVQTLSVEGKAPTVRIVGDDKKSLDVSDLAHGKFTYTPSPKGAARPEDVVFLELKLDGKPPLTENLKVEIEGGEI